MATPAPAPTHATTVVAIAPTRICLVGGGTDVDPYAAEFQGAILNVTIDLVHRVTLAPRVDRMVQVTAMGQERVFDLDEPMRYGVDRRFDLVRALIALRRGEMATGCSLTIAGDVPDSCGLGTSGSVAVAVLGALDRWSGRPLDRASLARAAFEVETGVLGWAGGKQDQWAAAYGGLALTLFGPGDAVEVQPLGDPAVADPAVADPAVLRRLRSWLMLIHSGGQRSSADLQVQLQARMVDDAQRRAALDELKSLALQARDALLQGRFEHLGELMHRGWQAKKRSNPAVHNERIDALYRAAREAGALGGKLVGAGGAGYIVLLCPPRGHADVRRAMTALDATPTDFAIAPLGLHFEGSTDIPDRWENAARSHVADRLELGRFDALIFDQDGTLLDAEALHCAAWCRVAAELGVPFDEAAFLPFAGLGDLEIARHLAGLQTGATAELDAAPDTLVARKRRHYGERLDELPLMPGALDMLQRARQAGFKLAMATSSAAEETRRVVERLQLDRWLDLIVHRESADPGRPGQVVQPKPEPHIYLAAAAGLGVPPQRCCAVEDTFTGMQSARAAGMAVVAVPTRFSNHADFSRADGRADSLHSIEVGGDGHVAVMATAPSTGRLEAP